MGQYTQRKRFDHPALAEAAEAGFHNFPGHVPGMAVTTAIVHADGGFWLYLTQAGELVTATTATDPGAILPDYEFVPAA